MNVEQLKETEKQRKEEMREDCEMGVVSEVILELSLLDNMNLL